ncbi:MAG: hypothetical protein JWM19_880 [Actinomycetia bacterium]|nr:hypothetical protein [Actinomycetes bacterium]
MLAAALMIKVGQLRHRAGLTRAGNVIALVTIMAMSALNILLGYLAFGALFAACALAFAFALVRRRN